jgi:putative transposase
MSRPERVEFEGALNHVVTRGNLRAPIYADDDDRHFFLDLFGHVVSCSRWLCHAYCLMRNHFHLLIETPEPNLGRGMCVLNGAYARRFNKRHGRAGHLFERRYQATLVDKESHLLEVCRYIVLNPVRCGACSDPGAWRWSSYRALAGLEPPPPFLARDWVLEQFAADRRRAHARYREFVADAL